jgi:ribosomal protein L7/L12
MDWTGVAIVVLAVAIVVTLVAGRAGRARTPSVPVPRPPLDPATEQAVSDLIARERKIEAIKRLRDATGMGLRDAKEWVEAWASDGTATPPAAQAADPAVLETLAVEARAVRDAAGAISAIRLVRDRTGWGLADSKAYVDRLG